MVFSSITFLCAFLPVILLLYWLIPNHICRNGLLIIASLLFYAYGEPVYVILMLESIVVNWLLGITVARGGTTRKIALFLAVVFNIGLLVVFKYLDWIILQLNGGFNLNLPVVGLPLPVGISFFTFQALSYVIDVARDDAKPAKNLFDVMLYISFFPQLIAGPIVKYHDIAKEIRNRTISVSEIAVGFRRFVWGLGKKVLIANSMAIAADGIFAQDPNGLFAPAAWLGAVAYMMQIYFDFSGYSDMAIGLGQMFGFHFKENFMDPYASSDIQDFWRRWHVSLTSWFRQYLYIPLGGNRKGAARTMFNKLVVFMATGLWHGANITFLIWGLYHGLLMMIHQANAPRFRLPKFLGHILTLILVCVGFVVFRADTLSQGLIIIAKMFTAWNFSQAALLQAAAWCTPEFVIALAAAILLCIPSTFWMKFIPDASWSYAISFCLLVLCMLRLAGGSYNPFIYFRF